MLPEFADLGQFDFPTDDGVTGKKVITQSEQSNVPLRQIFYMFPGQGLTPTDIGPRTLHRIDSLAPRAHATLRPPSFGTTPFFRSTQLGLPVAQTGLTFVCG